MSTRYMDWTDWAGDHHEEVEAERRAKQLQRTHCEHEEIDNQGACVDCNVVVPGWEPDEAQLDQHYGTSVAA